MALPNRPHTASAQADQAQCAASIGDASYLLRKAQRALDRARKIAGKYTGSEDDPAREQASRVLELCGHVDSALALVEGE